MKILVISSNLIGDTILSTGVVGHFLKNNPNARFTFIIGPTAGQIYQHFPNLEKIILIKKEKFNSHWLKIYLHSWNIKWDIIVDLRSSLLSFLLFGCRWLRKYHNVLPRLGKKICLWKFFSDTYL